MDPSGAGTCRQGQRPIDQSNAKALPSPAAFRDPPPQSLSPLVAEDADCGTGADCGVRASEAKFRGQNAEDELVVGKTKEQRGWRKVVRNFTPS